MTRHVISPDLAAALTDAEVAHDRNRRIDAWLLAKERQGYPISLEAGDRLCDLEARITGCPHQAQAALPCDPDPEPPAPAVSEVEAGRQRAEPALRHAVSAALRRMRGEGAA